MDIHLDTLLKLPNATVESCTGQDNEAYLKLRLLNEEASCPQCEQLSSELHQNRPVLIRDLLDFRSSDVLQSSTSSVLLSSLSVLFY